MYQRMKEVLIKKFGPWNMTISDEALFKMNKKVLPAKEWNLKWIMQENERGRYIEYYGIHKEREHLHGRIYDDGYEEPLAVLQQYIAYSPNILGDKERSMKEFEAYNRHLMNELSKKGLI